MNRSQRTGLNRGPTSADVAQRAQVSRTTVSFVLNGITDRGISQATCQRVLQAARELGYEPHAAARMLAGGATGTVALVLPSLAHLHVDAFLAQLLASINAQCHQHGLRLLIESTEGAGREPGDFVQLVRSRRIDGLILAHLRTAELAHVQQLIESGLPLVVLGCGLPEVSPRHAMGDDTAQSAQLAVQHLIGLGHRAIGFVNYASTEFHAAAQREAGWRNALAQHGIDAPAHWLARGDFSAESGWRATRALLARRPGITALFAGNDTIAFGALQAIQQAGLRVPQDVAVVGYDDIPLAAFATPPLTTVHSDPQGHGAQALSLLRAQMGDSGASAALAPDRVPQLVPQLVPHLVQRQSCGAPAQAQTPASSSAQPPAPAPAPVAGPAQKL
ncbi:LacI family DNA-binding transcriptional regulator [Aquabacterium sp. OR-4]|uniref:LacI family DNA-binding transcriptional regulator n=1 Tax=Aquabacterium sp. OR-4 TaxID=2978127 RepID=UPI0021B1F071|nr:LacI family DNA-binding transcriptional regulator [Aquabacterium sp. OR-4]MDT7838453.1 LacI family DNA-binding transcriptional regulator [Aquabacterium sp. OR-4]